MNVTWNVTMGWSDVIMLTQSALHDLSAIQKIMQHTDTCTMFCSVEQASTLNTVCTQAAVANGPVVVSNSCKESTTKKRTPYKTQCMHHPQARATLNALPLPLKAEM